ncbi:type II secretion system F family protein [Magnetovibrio sp. PR-2]|uniref:type II secretion system F family protein n=1 Tax=Magnetovibrio sp. PR-2 TaxID=3120356 RepID=UPI002FCDEA48
MFGIPTPTLIVWMAVLATIATVIGLALPFMVGGGSNKRVKQVANRRQELSRQQMAEMESKGSAIRNRRDQSKTDLMKKVLHSLKLDEALSSKELKEKLAQAGYRSPNALVVFTFTRLALAVGAFVVALIIISAAKDFPYPVHIKFVIMGLAAVAGFYLPKLLVSNTAQKRQTELNKGFADALDLMVICVEGGLSVEGAFDRVTQEIGENFPALAQEFGLTSAELAYLGNRHKAYMNFSDRTGLPAIKSLSTTLIQSEKYGTPVGQALKVLSQERREARMAAAEQKGASLPAKLTVPMILFFLPPLFMVVIGPAAIKISGGG